MRDIHNETWPETAFRADTGRSGYDAIAFSARPIAVAAPLTLPGIEVIRHLGVVGAGAADRPVAMLESASLHHELDALSVNINGRGHYEGTFGGRNQQGMLAPSGVSFYPAGTPISLRMPALQSALVIYLPRARLRGLIAEAMPNGVSRDLPVLVGAALPDVARHAAQIERELAQPGFAASLVVDGLVRAICGSLIGQDLPAVAAVAADRIRLSPARLARVVDFVEANLDRPLTLGDFAQVAGLSVFHFARVFRQATGQAPSQFLRARRIARACALLAGSEIALAELALACGFANQSHFTAAFGTAMGLPPGRYRRLRRD